MRDGSADAGQDHTFEGALPHAPPRARGAHVNPSNRFETVSLHVLGEHLDEIRLERGAGDSEDEISLRTRVFHDKSRSVINPVSSPDIPMAWTINPYRGCEHGCSYCYARPTHETFGLSAGLDFESRLYAKTDAAVLLRRELARKSWAGEPITMSGITDPYQPVERRLRVTRACLRVMLECGQPVSIITKSTLVTRDIDLLSPLAKLGAAHVGISITTLDSDLARKMEPRASVPRERLRAVRELSAAGVPVSVMTAPIIPGLNDEEIPALLEAVKEAGAVGAGYVMLRLPFAVEDVFTEWLSREFPERASKVLSLIRSVRGGELNDPRFGSRMRGEGAYADQISRTFKVFAARLGLNKRWPPLTSEHFRRPTLLEEGQMGLFGG